MPKAPPNPSSAPPSDDDVPRWSAPPQVQTTPPPVTPPIRNHPFARAQIYRQDLTSAAEGIRREHPNVTSTTYSAFAFARTQIARERASQNGASDKSRLLRRVADLVDNLVVMMPLLEGNADTVHFRKSEVVEAVRRVEDAVELISPAGKSNTAFDLIGVIMHSVELRLFEIATELAGGESKGASFLHRYVGYLCVALKEHAPESTVALYSVWRNADERRRKKSRCGLTVDAAWHETAALLSQFGLKERAGAGLKEGYRQYQADRKSLTHEMNALKNRAVYWSMAQYFMALGGVFTSPDQWEAAWMRGCQKP